MRYILLILASFVALVSALPATGELRQATRRQIVKRMASPVQRRQGLPSNGVYPLCTGSLPRGTPNSINTAVIANYVPAAGDFSTVTATSNVDCANRCAATANCNSASFSRGSSSTNCVLRGQVAFYVTDNNFDAIAKSQTCAGARTAINAVISCCDYVTSTAT